METNSKKKTIVLSVLVFLVILLVVIYYFFFGQNRGGEVDNNINNLNNPFGNFFPTDNVDRSDFNNFTESGSEFEIPRLRQITSVPVAGFTIFEKPVLFSTSTETVSRYAERASGHIYENKADESVNVRISNTTIPKVYDAIFLNNPDDFVYRFLDEDNDETIRTYLGKLTFEEVNPVSDTNASSTEAATSTGSQIQTVGKVTGSFLTNNINQIAASRAGNLFSLVINQQISLGNSLGYTFTARNSTTPKLVINSPITQWLIEWVDDISVAMTTKPSFFAEGFSYVLNTSTGSQEKILGPYFGLTTKYSPDKTKVFFSTTENESIVSRIFNVKTREILSTGFNTLAEKCTWAKDSITIFCAVPRNILGDFPDVWYMGLHSFNDSLISYNTETEEGLVLILDGVDSFQSFDMTGLKLSPNEDYILFRNKKDLSLWIYNLKE